jgi:uncharacterized protein (TIGR02452 family)
MKRHEAAEMGREIIRIIDTGRYTSPAGNVVEVGEMIRRAQEGTISYPADESLPGFPPGTHRTQIDVENETTLAAAQRLIAAGGRPAALNFASARHPGGGFLGGARAQEESLARASALYACINGNPMYAYHQRHSDAMYSNYASYSPDVPVLRDDDGELLAEPYLCAFITSPAVNAKVVRERRQASASQIRAAMKKRVEKVLTVAAIHGHESLVLGAWGCGVFGNDCGEIADLFASALDTTFAGAFAHVVFAVLDTSPERRFIGPFASRFGRAAR